jgi:glucosamine--fructose-6-phosphate aminotransferase (isomerizing)
MSYTQNEIFSQFESYNNTIDYIKMRQADIQRFFKNAKRVIFLGCGSSFCVAKSASTILNLYNKVFSMPIAAGDLLINFEKYKPFLNESAIVCLSRSGNSSEIVLAMKRALQEVECKCLLIGMQNGSELGQLSEMEIILDWAFDQSVCQTRSVSNLYIAGALLAAIISGDTATIEAFEELEKNHDIFNKRYEQLLMETAKLDWNNVVVLADCEIAGLAEEGALAFKEISRVNAHHYYLLDVRHGPMVNIDKSTLAILTTDTIDQYVGGLISDLQREGAVVLTINKHGADKADYVSICLPQNIDIKVSAVFMIYSIQAIAFYKAMQLGLNPDSPDGLDACIRIR